MTIPIETILDAIKGSSGVKEEGVPPELWKRPPIPPSKGFITTIAKRAGCTRMTIHKRMNKSATIREAIHDQKEMMKDFTENTLFKMIKSENTAAVLFYLKTQAKDRGYIERVEQIDYQLTDEMLNKATDEELDRIAKGEHPAIVLRRPGKG